MKQHYLDAYASLSEGLPGNDLGWVAAARQSAAARLDEVGFPTSRDEEWRYTSLRALAKLRSGFKQRDLF